MNARATAITLALATTLATLAPSVARPQSAPMPAPGAGTHALSAAPAPLLLRVHNARYGAVEMSADGGRLYSLVGRVARPASAAAPDAGATGAGSLVRSGRYGIAIAVGRGRIIRLLPVQPPSRRAPPQPGSPGAADIVTNIGPGQGPFGDLALPAGAPARLVMNRQDIVPMPDAYTPQPEDTIVIGSPAPAPAQEITASTAWDRQRLLQSLATAYAAGAVERANRNHRLVVSGILTLQARLPDGEPDPIVAVLYRIDGDVLAAQNEGPYAYAWDTRHAANGEHVVEIQALNKGGAVISRVRALVVVENSAKTG